MEELSIEQKAELYDESLKRAKEYHEDRLCVESPFHQPIIDVIEHIFPSLKEGEDEKIIKKIIESIKNDMTIGTSNDKKLALAWLEKQSEQNLSENSRKNSEYTTEEKNRDEYKKGYECGKQRVLKYPEDFGLCKKPADKVEQKWSKEDERKLSLLEALCDDRINSSAPYSTVYREMHELKVWLKFFRLQQKQISIWSEEDENRLKNLIELVNSSEENEPTKKGFINFINRLKSQRSQWKPSEEQLRELENVFSPDTDSWDENILRELHKQLKQL